MQLTTLPQFVFAGSTSRISDSTVSGLSVPALQNLKTDLFEGDAMKHYIYIVDKHSRPLMPTTRHSHVRKLLKSGKAVAISSSPFVVKLKYDTDNIVQPLYCGIDTGRENIGVGVSKQDGKCVYLSHLQTNNKTIKQKMEERRMHRQERRLHSRQRKQRKALRNDQQLSSENETLLRRKAVKSTSIRYPGMEERVEHKVIKGKEAKFANRKRCEGWLTPSARQLIYCHIEVINKIREILPISHLTVESVSFDFQKLDNEDIEDWNHGVLFGYRNYKEYINHIQNGKCLLCNNKIEHYHHIVPRSNGGSNMAGNIAGLCINHHDLVHKDKEFQALISELKEGYKQKYKVSLLNTIMSFLLKEYDNYCLINNLVLNVSNGYQTKLTREKFNLIKDHSIDGYAISLFNRDAKDIDVCNNSYELKRFKKKTNENINKLGQREYYLNNNVVAVNRHKATCQTEDSLEEFLSKQDDKNIVKKLNVKPAKRTYSYRREGVLCTYHVGDIVHFYKKNKIDAKEYNSYFPVLHIDMNNKSLYYTKTKNRRMKYCKRVKSRAIQYI